MAEYVIVEWNQASGRPSIWSEDTYDDLEFAAMIAEEEQKQKRDHGRRETYTVHELGDQVWPDEQDVTTP